MARADHPGAPLQPRAAWSAWDGPNELTQIRSLLLLSTCLCAPALAAAQDIAQETAAPTSIVLDEIVLSAGLTSSAADAYGRSYTVLTAEELDRRGLTTVQDALRAVPGVAVSDGGAGATQVRIRGGEGNHTLILIDGIEAAGGADEYMLSGLETDNVDRIEVLRGPQSVFYGSNASAGVINIITDKGEPGLHYGGRVGLGDGASASARVSQRSDRGGIALSLSATDDHGYDLSDDRGEKDGINRKTVGLSGDWAVTDDLTLGTALRWSKERYDYDALSFAATNADNYVVDDGTLFSDRRETQGGVWAEYAMAGGRVIHRLDLQRSDFRQSHENGPETTGRTTKLKYRLSYGLDGQPVAEARHLLNFLAERQSDESSAAPGFDRDLTAFALEYRGFLDNGLDIQAGLRRDDNEVFGDFTSWNLGLSWQVPDRPLRLHASAGRALVNPSHYELYVNDSFTAGNPNLRPETNRGVDIGIEYQLPDDRGNVDLTWFRERMDDEITYAYGAAPDGRATYVNQSGESPREGVELTGRVQATPDLLVALNYTYLDARNPDGSVETRRPRHELGLSATYAFAQGAGSTTVDFRHVSGNYDTQFWGAYPVREMDAYNVVNVSTSYDLTDNLRLTGRVVNLFDQDHSDVWGFATRGRTAYLGLSAKW